MILIPVHDLTIQALAVMVAAINKQIDALLTAVPNQPGYYFIPTDPTQRKDYYTLCTLSLQLDNAACDRFGIAEFVTLLEATMTAN